MAAPAVPQEQKQQELKPPNYLGKTNDIRKELARLKKEYGKDYAELYPRSLVQVGDAEKDKLSVSIMQFNVLADGLSGVHFDPKKMDDESSKKIFTNVPRECLTFNYRGFRIVEEIMRHNPDVVCMEECDQFEFLLHYLSPLGYAGVWHSKSKSPCVKVGQQNGVNLGPDGVAIFYRCLKKKIPYGVNTFGASEVTKYGKAVDKTDVDLAALSMVLTEPKSKVSFVVAVGHFKSTKSVEGEKIRLLQLQYLLPKLQAISVSTNPKLPVFFACDLNTNNHEVYSVNYDSIAFPDKLDPKNKGKPAMLKDYKKGYGLDLFSAYYAPTLVDSEIKENEEPSFTTWKRRSTGVMKHTIDYIFYQRDRAKVVQLLSIPKEKEINQKTLLPGFEYPSDHMAIMATFSML